MRKIVLIVTAFMFVMLFSSNPFDASVRLYQAIWNAGHFFLFAALIWLLITQTTVYQLSGLKMLLVSLLFGAVIGVIIEILQYYVGRNMQWFDVFTDMLGALSGFLAVQLTLSAERRLLKKRLIILFLSIILFIVAYPSLRIIRDNFKMASNFPVLSNFEQYADIERFQQGHVRRFEMDTNVFVEGRASALIEFAAGEYPRVLLEAVAPDWRGYRFLNMSIHNDQKDSLNIQVRVYDRQHRQTGYLQNDRFNYNISLKPGWNTLKIKLSDIYRAPENRLMNVETMGGVCLFLHNLQQVKTIHLDNIHLSNE